MDTAGRSLAGRLKHLIEKVHPPDRKPYSYREIAAGISERGLPPVTAGYLHQLATGARDNPSMRAVQALAAFFGVPVDYFFDQAVTAKIDAQLVDVARWRDSDARATAERIMQLDPAARRTVTALVDTLSAYEQQPREARRRRKPVTDDAP